MVLDLSVGRQSYVEDCEVCCKPIDRSLTKITTSPASTPKRLAKGDSIMARQHSHRFTIADDDAVRALVDKLVSVGPHPVRREKLLRALDDAARHYKDSNQKVRQAFFHGLLTGYAVALKLS